MNNKENKTPFISFFYNKNLLIPLSVFIAIVFWVVITITQNPVRNVSVSNVPVTINTEGTVISELGLGIVGEYTDEVTVKLSGPSYIVSSVKPSDLIVTASLAEVKSAGEYELELTASRVGTTTGYSVVGVKPSRIKVNFDAFDTNSFSVIAVANGASAKKGLVAESAIITDSEQSAIIVTGPHNKMSEIAEVRAVADVNKTLSETTSFNANLVFVDKDGNEIDSKNLNYNDQTIKITVPISKKRTLSVVPNFINPPNYYKRNAVPCTLSEKSITVIGPPETIDSMNSVELEGIDFSDITSGKKSFDVPLNLPNGVKSVNNVEYITVKLDLKNISKKTVVVKNIKAENLKPGLNVSLATDVQVTFYGNAAQLKNFSSKDAYISVDASEKTAGDYTLDAKINIKTAGMVWAVGEYQATVTLK